MPKGVVSHESGNVLSAGASLPSKTVLPSQKMGLRNNRLSGGEFVLLKEILRRHEGF